MPSRACVSGEARVTSSPSNRTDPAVGARSPERQLKNVDLPAPFGPIRPMMSPSWTSRSASDTARKLPNDCVTARASSSMAGLDRLGRFARGQAIPELEQAARLEARQQQDDAAIEDVRQAGSAAPERAVGGGLQRHQDDRADQRAEQGADAAERRRDDHLDGHQDAKSALRV